MVVICYDMDGVICEDITVPPYTEDYTKAIQTVPMLRSTHNKHSIIVTGRTENYRNVTEEWLSQHSIQYETLIMKPIALKGVQNTPRFKADHYKASDAIIFIESCKKQAKQIADLSGKPVFCVENNILY